MVINFDHIEICWELSRVCDLKGNRLADWESGTTEKMGVDRKRSVETTRS